MLVCGILPLCCEELHIEKTWVIVNESKSEAYFWFSLGRGVGDGREGCQPSEIWYKKIFDAWGKRNKNVTCVIKPEYVKTNSFSNLFFGVFFPFNEAFAHICSYLFILQVTSLNLGKQIN